jgi:lipopolysaccharide assembly outer membrane protein LptD (OstA)
MKTKLAFRLASILWLFLVLASPALRAAPVPGEEAFDVSSDHLSGSKEDGREIVILTGNVKIVHGTTTATADTGFYDKERETIRLAGNVTVKDQGVDVSGSQGEYFRIERRALFPRGIKVIESGSVLTADRGTYDTAGDSIQVEGDVAYSEGAKSMAADNAVYLRAGNLIRAWGNVLLKDESYGASLAAGRVKYLRDKKYGTAREHPVLEVAARENREAIIVRADSMEFFSDERRAVAIGDVRVLRAKAEGHSGRAVFLDLEDKSVLTETPTLVEADNSLSGDSITVYSKNEEISNVVVTGNARCIYKPASGERSELTGSRITLDFDAGKLSQMRIAGGATGVFEPAATDSLKGARNEVRGASMVLGFEDGKAKTANVVGGVKGLYRMEAAAEPAAAPAFSPAVAPAAIPAVAPSPQAVQPGAPPAGLPVQPGASSAAPPTEDVAYDADSLTYDVPASIMHLRGKASVIYRDMKLYSEEIEYNSDTYDLYATVEPVLWEGQDKITGSSLSYNLKTKRGAIIAGRTRFEKGFYGGSFLRKTGPSTLNVEGGTYTTCDYLDPHYTFTSSKMKIFLDDKVIARPVVLRIRGIPVFGLPFYMFPIKRGRHSGILIPRIDVGIDQTKGRFIRNAGYYWAPSEYFDVTAWGDYYQRSRWVGHMEADYNVRYLLNGSLDGSFTRDVATGSSRWDLTGSHNQTIGESGRLVTRVDFVSDKKYRKDTSDDLEKALRRVLESNASYSRSWEGLSMNLAAERRQDLDTGEISERLPTASLLMNRKTLVAPKLGGQGWHRGTYASGSSSFAASLDQTSGVRKTRQAGSANVNIDSDLNLKGLSQSVRSRLVVTGERKDAGEWCAGCAAGKPTHAAGDLRTDFIAKFVPFGWINFNPSASTQLTLYDQSLAGKKYPLRFMYFGGFDSRVTLYRTYFPRIGPLSALRHVISPSVAFSHRPDFSKYSGRFYSVSGVSGAVGKSSIMNIALGNRFQAKIGSGNDVRKIDDLFSLETATSYDFLYRDRHQPTGFSTISSNLRFYPSRYTTFDLGLTHEPVHLSLQSLDFQTRFSYTGKGPLPPGFAEPEMPEEPRVVGEGADAAKAGEVGSQVSGPWRFDLAYRYTKAIGGGKDSYWIELLATANLTRNWHVEYSGRFDLSGKQTVYQEYSIYRDLHCWEARFVRRYSAGDWEYYLRINIKAHPDIYAERGLRSLFRSY